jgi:hypothetical protein
MRIRFQTSGGLAYLPGLQRPIEIDVDAFEASVQAEWHRLVLAARFFELPATVGRLAKGAADQTTDTLTVEQDGRTHVVRVVASGGDEALQALLRAVRAEVKRVRALPLPPAKPPLP